MIFFRFYRGTIVLDRYIIIVITINFFLNGLVWKLYSENEMAKAV